MMEIQSPFNETYSDYEINYGTINYRDKIVLDLGADRGSTASFFLAKGARKVIAVEGNRVLARELRAECEKPQWKDLIVPIELWIDEPADIENLITTYKPDVVKSDIEHWEILFLDCKPDVLRNVREYVMEIHEQEKQRKLVQWFTSIGYESILIRSYDWTHVSGYVRNRISLYYFQGSGVM